MNPKKLLLLLVALLGLGAVAWTELVTNFYGKPLDATTFQAPSNGNVPQYVSATGKWTAQAITIAAGDIDELIRLEELSDVATMTEAAYDLVYRNAGNTAWDRLPKGSNSTVLNTSSGGVVGYGQITAAMVTANTLTAGEIAADAIGSSELADNAVDTNALQAAAVTLAKIQNAATSSKVLGSGAAGSGSPYAELTVGSGLTITGTTLSATGTGGSIVVQEADVDVDATAATVDFAGYHFDVTSSPSGEANVFLATDSVTSSSIAASAVGASEVADGTLTSADLSSSAALTSAQILDGELVNADINASAGIVYSKLAFSNNIVAGDIATGAVATAEILDGTVTGGTAGAGVDIAADTITAANIAADAITSSELADNSVDTGAITDGAILLADLNAALQSAAQGTESTRKIYTSTPAAPGAAGSAGSSVQAAAGDHVHAGPTGNVTGTGYATPGFRFSGNVVGSIDNGTMGVTVTSIPMASVTCTVSRTNKDVCLIAADAVVVQAITAPTTETRILTGVSVSPDKSTAGPAANGRDQSGAFSDDTWVYGYIIAKDDPAAAPAGLWSLSATAPTLPSGYRYRALVAVTNTGASATGFRKFYQDPSRTVMYLINFDETDVLSNGHATTMTAFDLNAGTKKLVPPNSRTVMGYFGITPNAAGDLMQLSEDGDSRSNHYATGQVASQFYKQSSAFACTSNQQLYYKLTSASDGGYFYVTGFRW